jgi:hypothetical protein
MHFKKYSKAKQLRDMDLMTIAFSVFTKKSVTNEGLNWNFELDWFSSHYHSSGYCYKTQPNFTL